LQFLAKWYDLNNQHGINDMKNLMKIAPIMAAVMFTGCASITDRGVAYMPDKSKAYNIAYSGGLVQGIKDTEIPKGESQALSKALTSTGYVGANFFNPQLGMSNWAIGGLSVMDAFLKPDTHSERNSLMAWMPMELASNKKEAQAVFLDNVKVATMTALDELGINNSSVYSTNEYVVVDIFDESWNCFDYEKSKILNVEMCEIKIKVFQPHKLRSPDFVSPNNKETWRFSASAKYDYSRVHFDIDKENNVPTDEIYQQISKKLPDWSYLYIAPRRIKTDGKTDYTFPYILNKGGLNLFVTEIK
jgi:hypothetical protein